MTRWLPLPLIILAGALGFLWHRSEVAHAIELARAAAQTDSLRREVAAGDAAAARLRASNDSARGVEATRAAEATAAAERAQREGRAAAARLDVLLDSLRSYPERAGTTRNMPEPPGEIVAQLDALGVQLEVERAAHRDEVAALRLQVGSLEAQLALADSSVALAEGQLSDRDALIASLEAELALARPGWIRRVLQNLPLIGTAAGVGLATGIALR